MNGRALRRLPAALALLAGLFAAPGGQARAEELTRLTLRQDLLGWEAVGRLDLGRQGYCTAVLIAADLALTAAHCLVDDDGRPRRDAAGLVFRAGLRDGQVVAERTLAQAVIDPRYRPGARADSVNIRHDVALLQLAQPIPTATAAPFRVATASGDAVSVVSYGAGRDDALSREAACQVLLREAGLLAFDCDVDFGSSGAPVFDLGAGRPRIVSLISAGRRDSGMVIAFGMELPDRVAGLKAEIRAGRGLFASDAPAPRRLRPAPDRQEARRPDVIRPEVMRLGQPPDSGAKFLRP